LLALVAMLLSLRTTSSPTLTCISPLRPLPFVSARMDERSSRIERAWMTVSLPELEPVTILATRTSCPDKLPPLVRAMVPERAPTEAMLPVVPKVGVPPLIQQISSKQSTRVVPGYRSSQVATVLHQAEIRCKSIRGEVQITARCKSKVSCLPQSVRCDPARDIDIPCRRQEDIACLSRGIGQ